MSSEALKKAVSALPSVYRNGQRWRDGALIRQAVEDADWATVLAYATVIYEARRLVDAAEREDGE